MAEIKETFLLEFVVDDGAIDKVVEGLVDIGAADKSLADKVKQGTAAFSERTKQTKLAADAQAKLAAQTKSDTNSVLDLGKALSSTTRNLLAGGLKEFSFSIRRGIVESLQEAGVSLRDFKAILSEAMADGTVNASNLENALTDVMQKMQQVPEAGKKIGPEVKRGADQAATGVKTLALEARLAKEELARLLITPGVDPLQLQAAGKKAGELKDRLNSLNQTVEAFNPEKKLQAVSAAGQGIYSSFQIATGALQAMGLESERVNKLLQQFQGLINVSQGINQLLALKGAFKDLSLVLGTANAATSGLAVAQEAAAISAGTAAAATGGVTVAAEGAAVATGAATTGMAGLAAVALPIVAVFAALAAAAYYLTESLYEEAEAIKKTNEEFKKSLELADALGESYLAFVGGGEQRLAIMREQGAEEQEILAIRQGQIRQDVQLLKAAAAKVNDTEKYNAIVKEILKLQNEQELNEIKITNAIKKKNLEILLTKQAILEATQANQAQLKKQYEDELRQKEQAKVDGEGIERERLNTAIGLAEDTAKKIQTINNNTIQDEKELNLESQRNAIALTKEKILLNEKYGESTTDLQLQLSEQDRAYNETVRNNAKITQEEILARIRMGLEVVSQVTSDMSSIMANARANELNQDIGGIEKLREAELNNKRLTEEQKEKINKKYDERIAKEKEKAARAQRKADEISLVVNQAVAIGKLATENPPPSPAFFVGLTLILSTFAAQLSAIRSAALPKYATGKEYVNGKGTGTSDSIHAMLSRGERVVSAKTNADYFPALSAIHNRKISPAVANELLSGLGRNFNDSKSAIDTNIKQSAISEERMAKAIASEMLKGLKGIGAPSEYDKQSTEFLRAISSSLNKDPRQSDPRRN